MHRSTAQTPPPTSTRDVARLGGGALGSVPPWLRHADRMLREQFDRPLTVRAIAAEVGVHPVHLSRVFRRIHRASIGDTLRSIRVRYACARLHDPRVELADLALSAGFCDQSQLTRAFKRVVGTTPGRYRAKSRRVALSPVLPVHPSPLLRTNSSSAALDSET
ncbi:MAG: AraC family transcriptional regulator [Acidobacteriota bacterium]